MKKIICLLACMACLAISSCNKLDDTESETTYFGEVSLIENRQSGLYVNGELVKAYKSGYTHSGHLHSDGDKKYQSLYFLEVENEEDVKGGYLADSISWFPADNTQSVTIFMAPAEKYCATFEGWQLSGSSLYNDKISSCTIKLLREDAAYVVMVTSDGDKIEMVYKGDVKSSKLI